MTPDDPLLVLLAYARNALVEFERAYDLVLIASGVPVRPNPNVVRLFHELTVWIDAGREITGSKPGDDQDGAA